MQSQNSPQGQLRGGEASADLDDRSAAGEAATLAPRGSVAGRGPGKIFLLRTQQLRPYQRLDRKYGELFAAALADFTRFKALQLENFSKSAQMTLQQTTEIGQIKNVVQLLQDAVEDAEVRFTGSMEEEGEKIVAAIKHSETKTNQLCEHT